MGTLLQDLRYGVRLLLKNPGFTAAAVVSLAIGIGANTAIFSLANALLLRPLPVDEPQRLVNVHSINPDGSSFHTFSYPDFQDFAGQSQTLDGITAYTVDTYSLSESGQSERIFAAVASGNFFSVMGVRPAAGRFFTPDEDHAPQGEAVVVVGHGFWQRRLGGDPEAVGRTLTLGGEPYTVVGVAPKGFTGPRVGFAPDVFVPLWSQGRSRRGSEWLREREAGGLELVGRLKRGATLDAAQAELRAVFARSAEQFPEVYRGRGLEVRPTGTGLGQFQSPVSWFMGVLMAVVGLVLLIACANVAAMMLARAATRRKEIAIRLAMGARRARVVRQLLTESVLLFLLGGAAGVLLAVWLTDFLLALKPTVPFQIELDLGLDARVLLFTLSVALLTGVAFGLAPALQASRPEVLPALKDESGGTFRRSRLLSSFVVGQVALSLVLLVSTGLFLRSLGNARSMNPGFDPEGVQVVGLDLEIQNYDEARGRAFYRELMERVKALPGVRAATMARLVPLNGGNMATGINVEGHEPQDPRRGFETEFNVVGADYFSTLSIPVVRGRDFDDGDRKEAPPVAVVNETMAARYWPGQDPVGQRFFRGAFADGRAVEVVGVARDSKYDTLGEEPKPFFYLPFEQSYEPYMTLHVRGAGGADAAVLASVRAEIAALDPVLPQLDVMPMTQAMGSSLVGVRTAASVAGVFGLAGLGLAAVGIFGVVSFSVAQRTREIGVRVALGARPRDVLRLVIAQGMKLALIGLAIGLAGAFAVTRVLGGLLYGVGATDALTFVSVSLLLAAVALLASYLPARRATKVDPMVALRYE